MNTPISAVRDRGEPVGVAQAVLTVDGLSVRAGQTTLVDGVDLTIRRGERVGLIGESGSGKTLTALGILGLLPDELTVSGSVRLADVPFELLGARERERADVRGRQLAMVFQEPMTALNPSMRVGAQVAEAMTIHGRADAEAQAAALDLLAQVRLPDPPALARAYPHQLSGGQRQRVVLAIALANDPALLICDEPSTALDVTVQAQVLDLVVTGVEARDAALLFITHDLAVVATVCERVLVLYGGRVVEAGPVGQVLTAPRHPYTRGLLLASDLERVDEHGHLVTIPGAVPSAGHFPAGCVFRNRCPRATVECAQVPPWTGPDRDLGFACFHPYDDGAAEPVVGR
jgi:peptide/nickel transport system ATP-binding protein